MHLAEKIKGAVALKKFRLTGDPEQQQQAIKHLEQALAYWDDVIRITRPIYPDMPLTHYNHILYDENKNNLFHWALIRDQVKSRY